MDVAFRVAGCVTECSIVALLEAVKVGLEVSSAPSRQEGDASKSSDDGDTSAQDYGRDAGGFCVLHIGDRDVASQTPLGIPPLFNVFSLWLGNARASYDDDKFKQSFVSTGFRSCGGLDGVSGAASSASTDLYGVQSQRRRWRVLPGVLRGAGRRLGGVR